MAGGFRIEPARFDFWPKRPWPIRLKIGDDDDADDGAMRPKRAWSSDPDRFDLAIVFEFVILFAFAIFWRFQSSSF